MSLPVITETIVADDPTLVSGSIRLYAQNGGGGVAYTNAGTPLTIGQVIRVSFNSSGILKADDGITALTLNPNSGSSSDAIATPTGTVWEYEIRYPNTRTSIVRYLNVTDVAGPLNVANILSDVPAGLVSPYTQRYAVAKAGDTMTGALTLSNSVTNALIIPDVGGTYNALVFHGAAPNVSNPMFKIRAASNGTGTYNIFVVTDSGNAPIGWFNNAGGLSVNDMIRMVDDSGSYFNGIGFQYLNESSRKGFSLVFGHSGTTGSTFVDGGITYNRDAFKAFYLRLNDSNQIVASTAVSVAAEGSLVPIVITPTAGPASQPGFSIGITSPARVWRSGSAAWASDSTWEFQSAVKITETAAGTPGITGVSTTTTGLRWDATLGLVIVNGGTDRWRVGASGNLNPAADNAYSLGSTTAYITTGFMHAVDLGNSGVYSSNGTPEAATTAKPGSIDEDYTNGTVYVKKTGTGNTGWSPLAISRSATGAVGRVSLTTGDLTCSSTTWAAVTATALDITLGDATYLPLTAGMWVELNLSGFSGSATPGLFFDVITVNGSNFISGLANATNTSAGVQGWRCGGSTNTNVSGPILYQLQAGDISSGTAKFRPYWVLSTAGSRSLLADTNAPLIFTAKVVT